MESKYPFVLHWVFGHQTSIPVINISSTSDKKIFFASGQVVVIFDWTENKQYLLQGHKNEVVALACTSDKKYLASVDEGQESSLIIWTNKTRSVFHAVNYFSEKGVAVMCFTSDGSLLFVLSKKKPQEITIWDWKARKMHPDFVYKFTMETEIQHHITVHQAYPSHFASCGNRTVHFFKREENDFKVTKLDATELYDEKSISKIGNFTQTTFNLLSTLAATGTTRGAIVLWDRPLHRRKKPARKSTESFTMNPDERVCLRMIQALDTKAAISFLSSNEKYIIAGTGNSEILFYNENFSIQWSKKLASGQINNISFLFTLKSGVTEIVEKNTGEFGKRTENLFEETSFIVSTSDGYVGYYSSESKVFQKILHNTYNFVRSIALHPVWPFLYFGDYDGKLQKWNYETKGMMNVEVYEETCSQVELITVDPKGAYTACAMSNGNIAIFDAVCLSAKPFYTADDVLHKPITMKFSPDSQHLLIIDISSNVSLYCLQLLVPLKVFQMMEKEKAPAEKPFLCFRGKTRQHQSRIVDSMFNDTSKEKSVFFYTLGEDRCLVQYNISGSKGLDIEISKRITLKRSPIPMCMTWYPLYGVLNLVAILNNDGKMRVYSIETQKMVRMVSLPLYDEPIKKIYFQSKLKNVTEEEFPDFKYTEEDFQYFIFCSSHNIGLAKYPIDGNPHGSLAQICAPSEINEIAISRDQRFLFIAGINNFWIFMYKVNIMLLLRAEKEYGDGLDAFKFLFPSTCDPDGMKKTLIYAVYALELEMKMLRFVENEKPILTGEIPIDYLEYVLAALGCFVSPNDLEMMLNDIEFERKYKHDGKKTTLNCLDIMKLYVNYRPTEPITKSKLRDVFRDIIALEEDPDKMARARFIHILSSRGDVIPQSHLVNILSCLQWSKSGFILDDLSSDESPCENDKSFGTSSEKANTENALKKLIPEFITEDILLQDILCLEKAEEDLTKYILKSEDYKCQQEYPKLEDFISVCEKLN